MRAFLYTGRVLFDAADRVATFCRRDDRVRSFEVHIRYRQYAAREDDGAMSRASKYLVIGAAIFHRLPWDWKFWRNLDDTRVLTGLDAQQAYDEEFSKHI